MSIISFIYKLLFDSENNSDSTVQSELFHSDDYLRPDKINFRKCPNCSTKAETNKNVIELFGVRTINGRSSVQSWCKNCRKNKRKNNQDENEIESLF